MTVKDEWVTAAMSDDRLVVELLLRLKQSKQVSSPYKSSPPVAVAIPPRWGLRQPRSRMVSAFRFSAVSQRNKEADLVRCSPTTPLSWSGGSGSSPSGTADGFEESSARSKDNAANDSTCTTISAKRSRQLRKEKTFAELKEKEILLLDERVHLKKELATLHTSFKEHRAENESLKKVKLDMSLCSEKNLYATNSNGLEETTSTSRQPHQREYSTLDPSVPTLPMHTAHDNYTKSDPCKAHKSNSTGDGPFLLPDLNMSPTVDDWF